MMGEGVPEEWAELGLSLKHVGQRGGGCAAAV